MALLVCCCSHSVAKSCPILYVRLQPDSCICHSLSPGVCSNSHPLNLWCYLTILLSVALLFFCFQSFPASGYLPMSLVFASCGQNIGASASASVLPMNIQGQFPSGLTRSILQSEELVCTCQIQVCTALRTFPMQRAPLILPDSTPNLQVSCILGWSRTMLESVQAESDGR